jgi:acetoin:2,6-dichlorophenolindophenol oxidoreductase subunit alpha
MNAPDDYELYRRLVLVRRVEEWIIAQYAAQNAAFARKEEPALSIRCPTHLSIGQEAAAVGVCGALRDTDVAYSTHRCHAHYLAKGGSVDRMIAELCGRVTGCSKGKGGSMHLLDVDRGMYGASAVVGGSIPLAVGAAFAAVRQGRDDVGVAFFGDGAVEQGIFHESLNYASLKRLPVLFVCENNFYATLSHVSTRQRVGIAQRAAAYDMVGVEVEGVDTRAVLRAATEAVARARRGEGPTLLEVKAYRWMSHVGTEFDTGKMLRSSEELDAWRARCPVTFMRNTLAAEGVTDARLDEAEEEARVTIEKGVAFALASAEPAVADLYRDLAGEAPVWLG